MKPVVVIVGPTAIGKSNLALQLAQALGGEIVNADSRQVYRYLDIGTAKPTAEQRSRIPHHLIDVVDPDQQFSLALYQEMAYSTIKDIQQRDKLPLLVGGSGLYIWSVVEGWHIPHVPPDPELRRSLEEKAQAEGPGALYRDLEERDPVAARRIDPRNLRRVIRALEVMRDGGVPLSKLQRKGPPMFQTLLIGLTVERDELYRRIDSRVDDMIERGLVAEVESLVKRGYSLDLPSMSGLGYRQLGEYLRGKIDLPQAIQQIKYESHRFARHQYAWFHLTDGRIRWFEVGQSVAEVVLDLVSKTIKGDLVRSGAQ